MTGKKTNRGLYLLMIFLFPLNLMAIEEFTANMAQSLFDKKKLGDVIVMIDADLTMNFKKPVKVFVDGNTAPDSTEVIIKKNSKGRVLLQMDLSLLVSFDEKNCFTKDEKEAKKLDCTFIFTITFEANICENKKSECYTLSHIPKWGGHTDIIFSSYKAGFSKSKYTVSYSSLNHLEISSPEKSAGKYAPKLLFEENDNKALLGVLKR